MTDLRLSAHEVEEVLAGRQPPGRADLAPLAEIVAVLHASSEVEPAPPMSADLVEQIEVGNRRALMRRGRRHRPRHLAAAPGAPATGSGYRRAALSLSAAAVLLVGLVLATSRGGLPKDVDAALSDMGSTIGLELAHPDAGAPATTAPPTTATTVPPTTATTAAPPPSAAAAPPTTAASSDGWDGDWRSRVPEGSFSGDGWPSSGPDWFDYDYWPSPGDDRYDGDRERNSDGSDPWTNNATTTGDDPYGSSTTTAGGTSSTSSSTTGSSTTR
jgi:hypothetical protein